MAPLIDLAKSRGISIPCAISSVPLAVKGNVRFAKFK